MYDIFYVIDGLEIIFEKGGSMTTGVGLAFGFYSHLDSCSEQLMMMKRELESSADAFYDTSQVA